jgi:chromosome segregation ATPase
LAELADLQTELAEVRAALTKARRAVSTNTGDVTVQRNYTALLAERDALENRIARLQRSRPTLASMDISGGQG